MLCAGRESARADSRRATPLKASASRPRHAGSQPPARRCTCSPARMRRRRGRARSRQRATLAGESDAGDDRLRRQLRHGRQAADRALEDRRRQQVPADLDRPRRGGRDPDEAAGLGACPPAHARPADEHPRRARSRGGADHRDGATREHVLRPDHASSERPGARDRLPPLRRDRDRRPRRGEDLRHRRGDRGVGDRVRG